MEDIIFVKGNIIFNSGDHLVKELLAYADEYEKIAEQIIEGDLIVTEDDDLEPYKIFCSSQDIIIYGNFISVMQRPDDVIRIYNDEINNLQKLREEKINSDLIPVLNRQIYIGVVGSMELFLCDFLFSMVLGSKDYYLRFCESSTKSFKLKEISTKSWRVLDGVIKAIIETNYHRIDDVKTIYKKILDLDFPPSEKLKNQILTRHGLVHRNGWPSKKSEYVQVTDKMIDELIFEVQKLIDYIIKMKEKEINEWFSKPIKS